MDTPAEQGPAPLLADDRALDFLNTRAAPGGRAIEWIADGGDLLAWLARVDWLTTEQVAQLGSQPGAVLDGVAGQARGLREWFRGVVDARAGQHPALPTPEQAARLNAVLAGDALSWRMEAGLPGMALRRSLRDPADLLRPIAEAMARLLCEGDFSRVRRCESDRCTLHFVDVSKNGTRRWCSMAGCGNRAKAAQHRAKRRTTARDQANR